ARMAQSAEFAVRLAAFGGVFAIMALWELLAPRRPWSVGRVARWPSNLGILIVDALLVRLLIPTAAVGVALLAAEHGFGLFHLVASAARLGRLAGVPRPRPQVYGPHVQTRAHRISTTGVALAPTLVPQFLRLHRFEYM